MRGFAIFLGFFAGGGFLFGLEFLDATELVDETHLAREERMAFGADIDGHGVASGTCLERRTAGASDRDLVVGGMNACFHRRNSITKCLFCASFGADDTVGNDGDGDDGTQARSFSQEEVTSRDCDHTV